MQTQIEKLNVEVYKTRSQMGKAASDDVVKIIRDLLEEKDEVRMIFAAAPSQNELLEELAENKLVDWSRITAFHMDEYIGLDSDAPQLFGKFLSDRIFDKVSFKKVHLMNTNSSSVDEVCNEYTDLLKEKPIDIVCMGIGENGHIAFNDPPYADFKDYKLVKVVELDNVSRMQQVNDGCFETFDDVPKQAVTLTIPALLSPKYKIVVVPGNKKALAVEAALKGPVTDQCPASILREQDNTKLYLDEDSASCLLK